MRWITLLMALSLVVALAACDLVSSPAKNTFNAVDITGADYAKDFHLTDHTGKARTLADFKGKAVLLFFGYTHCPDVCPTTLADAAKMIKALGADGQRVQVLFVTLDPRRDTQEVLAKYVPAFGKDFLGLYTTEAGTRDTAKDFHIFYEERPGATPDSYSVDHTAGTLVFDPHGRLRLYVNYGMAPDKIAADVKKLLA
jgi:protein SCO1/2